MMNLAQAWKILSRKEPAELYDLVGQVLKDTGLRNAIVEGSSGKTRKAARSFLATHSG
ncbi:MAG TPA: hypothetical protein VF784_03800 [Anaerolineales bacterium]